jgi:hypothetical protein
MTSPLLPSLTGRTLSMDAALNQPSIISQQIAKLADSQVLLPRLFRQYGAQVQGGAILYNSVSASDFYTSNIEKRTPGSEYVGVEGVSPEPQLALVEDWGGWFSVPVEAVLRQNISMLDQQTTQLANRIAKVLDQRAVEVLEDANPDSIGVSTPWEEVKTVGPLTDLTASAELPTAAFAEAQELADLDELGVVLDTLLVHPSQARALKTAYGPQLADVLDSAGLQMFSNPRIADGTAYIVQGGMVGTIGFEFPLTTEAWIDKDTRSWKVQSFVVPALAIDRPYACKKLTGLAS